MAPETFLFHPCQLTITLTTGAIKYLALLNKIYAYVIINFQYARAVRTLLCLSGHSLLIVN